jgi:hypothetical protein
MSGATAARPSAGSVRPPFTSGTIVAAALLALLAAGIAYRYWPNDDRAVRRHLVHLAEALSVPGKETEVERMTRVAALREYFLPDVRVAADGRDIVSRDALIGLLLAWTPPPGGFSVEAADQTVTLADDHATARITLTAKVVSKDLASGEALVDARDLDIAMAKAENDWVISNVVARPITAPLSPR